MAFIATKYVAFHDHGEGDYYASHDLEDLIIVLDGREKIVDEVVAAGPARRDFVAKAVAKLTNSPDFMEAAKRICVRMPEPTPPARPRRTLIRIAETHA